MLSKLAVAQPTSLPWAVDISTKYEHTLKKSVQKGLKYPMDKHRNTSTRTQNGRGNAKIQHVQVPTASTVQEILRKIGCRMISFNNYCIHWKCFL